MIRVVIIADTLLRARTLANLLAEDEHLDIVDARAGSRDFPLSRSQMVDVIVVAGFRPDDIPLEGPPIVALANGAGQPTLGRAVHAWLPLHSSAAELASAIICAANGLVVLTQEQARRWSRGAESSHADAGLSIEALTPRELQVLRMLADGLGNKEIAGQLGLSDHTAKFHVAQILAKLGASSRTEAVTIGIRRGLIPI